MAGEGEDEQQEQGKGRHLVLLPLPFQGHINPMLQLANLLHSKGFSITIIHPQLNSPNPSDYPNFNFEIIPDGFSEPQRTGIKIIELLSAVNTNCEAPLRECLARLQAANPLNPISCLITDAILYSSQTIAEDLGLPRIVLRTSSPFSFLPFAMYSHLKAKGYLPIQDDRSDISVVELPPLRVKDLPGYPNTDVNAHSQFFEKIVNTTRSATALILNSSDHLERAILPELHREFPIPIFFVGPLCKSSSSVSSNRLSENEQSCLDWLDKQESRSVLYVSFGSVTEMEEADLAETAWGLANSEQPFLWVIRPGLVTGSERTWPHLPEGFAEKTKGKGWVVKWAPQQKVLVHPAVGGFWTHAGWNSTLEGICSGVPMICWPRNGDQTVNARLVSCSWKVGLQLEGDRLERGEIEKGLRKLMADKEGEEMRERARVLKETAELCVIKGGSSYEAMNKLVNHILSL